jgi:hypothetical protein
MLAGHTTDRSARVPEEEDRIASQCVPAIDAMFASAVEVDGAVESTGRERRT